MVEKYFIKMLFERSEESYLNVLRSKIFHVDKVNISFAEGVYHVLKAHIIANASRLLGWISLIKSRRSLVYHPQLVAVYHQRVMLYIIKPQKDAR